VTRLACIIATCLLLAPAQVKAAAPEPLQIVDAIYARVLVKDSRRENFMVNNASGRRKYYTAGMVKLFRDAYAKTPKGDQGPIAVDPITNSQDPQVKAYDAQVERQDRTTATVLARLSDKPGPIGDTHTDIRYDFKLERGRWLIDNIRNDGAKEWWLRQTLERYVAKPW
jgi:hypothetical protein